MYLSTRLAVPKCLLVGQCINLASKLDAYMMSGLVAVRYRRLPTMLLYSSSLTAPLPSSLVNFSVATSGVITDLHSFRPNLLSKELAYFFWWMKMLELVWITPIPRKWWRRPKCHFRFSLHVFFEFIKHQSITSSIDYVIHVDRNNQNVLLPCFGVQCWFTQTFLKTTLREVCINFFILSPWSLL